MFGTTSAPGSRAAGMQGPADADHPPAKRARLSGGHSNRSTAQQRDNTQAGTGQASGSAGSRPRYVVPAYSSLIQAEGLQLDLQEELGVAAEVADHPVGPEGVPLDELCELLQGVVEAAVEVFDQGALSAGTVKQDGERLVVLALLHMHGALQAAAAATGHTHRHQQPFLHHCLPCSTSHIVHLPYIHSASRVQPKNAIPAPVEACVPMC